MESPHAGAVRWLLQACPWRTFVAPSVGVSVALPAQWPFPSLASLPPARWHSQMLRTSCVCELPSMRSTRMGNVTCKAVHLVAQSMDATQAGKCAQDCYAPSHQKMKCCAP
eukprot:3411667-Amphidinium_carterae.1